jgi:hypothetical protein
MPPTLPPEPEPSPRPAADNAFDAPTPQGTPLPLPATTGEVVGSAPGEYLGYALRETSGSAAVKVVLYDNATAASGAILDEIELAEGTTNEVHRDRGDGVVVNNGIWAVITGAGAGSIFQ